MECLPCEEAKRKQAVVYEKAKQYAKENNLSEIVIVRTKNGFPSFRRTDDESIGRLEVVEYLRISEGTEI